MPNSREDCSDNDLRFVNCLKLVEGARQNGTLCGIRDHDRLITGRSYVLFTYCCYLAASVRESSTRPKLRKSITGDQAFEMDDADDVDFIDEERQPH